MIHEVMPNAAVIYQHGVRSFAVDSKEEEEDAALKIIKILRRKADFTPVSAACDREPFRPPILKL